MKFSSDVSLTHRASVSAVSSFWNNKDIVASVMDLLLSDQIDEIWADVEKKVLLQLAEIILPDILNSSLKNLIQPMGREILKWISLTRSTFRACSDVPEAVIFYWTERGALDYVKTTRFVIDHSRRNTLRFCLACVFCMEEIISELWPEVDPSLCEGLKKDPSLIETVTVIYWGYHMSNKVEDLMTLTEYCGVRNPHEYAFLLTLDAKCVQTSRYFLERVELERKERLVLVALDKIFTSARPYDGNVLNFLLGYVKESELNRLIEQNPYCVLASFLEWPCQEYFMPIANIYWNHLSRLDYLNLFHDIVSSVSKYSMGCVYKNLAQTFWRSSPRALKNYIVSKCKSGTFLSRLFLRDNTDEIVVMILNDCTPGERREIIFYFEGMNICDLLVKREKWSSLKLFINSCIPNDDVLEEFIAQYETSKPCYCNNDETALRTAIFIKKITEWF